MATVPFHHGTRIFESAETPILVRIGRTAVVGIIGTAESVDPLLFPLNKPVQVLRPQDVISMGYDGTLRRAIDLVQAQVACPIIVVRVEAGETTAETWANLVGNRAAFTGVHAFRRAASDGLYKPKMLIAPGFTQTSPADGIASVNVTAGGTGYDQATTTVAISGGAGAGAVAEAVVTEGAVTSIIVRKAGYGYTAPVTVTITGGAGAKDAAATGNIGSVMNPVVAELAAVADPLKAIAYVDGPDTSDQAAVQYRNLINSGRIVVCDPKVLAFDTELAANVPTPSSPIYVGQQAKMDLSQGFHWAGSNVEVSGIVGVNRPIEYGEQSDYLNENRVNTIVNIDGTGFRLWGVWTCASDPMWQFIPVRRTADAINDAIEKAYLEFVDKPFTRANLKFLVESGRNFLRTMELEGAILPGHDVWLADTNTDNDMAQGIVKLGIKYEPPAPMTDIQGTAHRNTVSYTLLLNQVAQEIGDGTYG